MNRDLTKLNKLFGEHAKFQKVSMGHLNKGNFNKALLYHKLAAGVSLKIEKILENLNK